MDMPYLRKHSIYRHTLAEMQEQAKKNTPNEVHATAKHACKLCHRPHTDPASPNNSRLAVYTGYSNASDSARDVPTETLEGVPALRLELQQMAATIATLQHEMRAGCLEIRQLHVRTAAHTKHSFAKAHARIDSVQCEMRSHEWAGQVDVALQLAQTNMDMHHLRQQLQEDHHACAHTNAALRRDQDMMLFHLYSQIGAYVGVTTARTVQEVQAEIAQKLCFLEQRMRALEPENVAFFR